MRIKDWNDFDNRLREIALIDLAVTEAGRKRDLALIDAETKYKEGTAARLATRAVAVKELEKFYRTHRKEAESGGKKSREFFFGRVGLRARAARLALRKGVKWPAVVAAIKEKFPDWLRFVNVKESVKKDGTKRGLSLEQLDQVGLTLKAGEEFFIETFPEKLKTEQPAA